MLVKRGSYGLANSPRPPVSRSSRDATVSRALANGRRICAFRQPSLPPLFEASPEAPGAPKTVPSAHGTFAATPLDYAFECSSAASDTNN